MFDNEVSMKRINVFTGHFGSGKTEIAINYAKKLKQAGIEKVTLVDLDIVNPFFCSREFTEELGALGIRVISQGVHLANAELMVVTPEVLSAFNQKDHTVIFDVGGDDMGALALGQYNRFFKEEPYDMFFVINANRPMTKDLETAKEYLDAIEVSSRLKVTQLVNNTNMSYETKLADIEAGEHLVGELSEKLGIPLAFTAVRRDLVEEAKQFIHGEILPIDIYMKPPWR